MKLFIVTFLTLPQSLIGAVLYLFVQKKQTYICKKFDWPFIMVKTKNFNGVSLGGFIFLNERYFFEHEAKTIKHEYGHLLQGLILACIPFGYLLIIGIKSLINNRRSINNFWVRKNYYKLFPENWADKLGKVKR